MFVLFVLAPSARAQDGDGLVRARAALRAGDTQLALELARAVIERAERDKQGAVLSDAYVVLGLTLMRREEPEAALRAFERALEQGDDARGDRPVIDFNRGVCLFDLERYEEAEQAFLASADHAEGSLAALAALNAGFAAYEGGDFTSSRAHLARAKQLDRDADLAAQLDELQADLDASAQPDAGDERSSEPKEVVEEIGTTAVTRYEIAIAAYKAGMWSAARRELVHARKVGLDPDRDAAALVYVDLMSGGLRRAGRDLSLSFALFGGYDSNVTQTGLGDSNALLGEQSRAEADAFGRAQLDVGYGLGLTDRTFARADYELRQLVYSKAALDVMNAQDHDLVLAIEHRISPVVRAEVSALGSLSFMGLRALRALSWSAGGEGKLGFDYGDGFASEARLLVLGTDVLASDFSFLQGHRIEAGLSQEYRQRGLSVGGEASYRVESLGTQTFETSPPDNVCPDCAGVTAIPLAYDGPSLAVWGSKRFTTWLRGGVRARVDWRMHRDPTGFVISTPFGREFEGTVRTQRDTRLSVSVTLTAELIGPLEAQLSYGILKGASNIDNTRGGDHALDYGNLNFTRHVLELGLIASD